MFDVKLVSNEVELEQFGNDWIIDKISDEGLEINDT